MRLLAHLVPSTLTPPATSRVDGHDIARAVVRYCRHLDCDESNTLAAVAFALRSPGHTLECIRAGKKRAEQLRFRQSGVRA